MAYVKENTCGSCKNYEYEGENTKGFCSYYRSYYYPDDNCGHWEMNDNCSATGGCFLTSACCRYKGLPDDCAELEALRRFRDGFLREQTYGPEMIRLYYEDAPGIVEAIEKSSDRDSVYQCIYHEIETLLQLIENDEPDTAVVLYMLMVYKLKNRLGA